MDTNIKLQQIWEEFQSINKKHWYDGHRYYSKHVQFEIIWLRWGLGFDFGYMFGFGVGFSLCFGPFYININL